MTGTNDWNVKPNKIADTHPCEIYDAESDRYYYVGKKKTFNPKIEINCDIAPSTSTEYAEIIKKIFRENYPDFKAVGDAPIAIQLSVYPVHFYQGGLQPYVMGESVVEWEKWLFEALTGVVWVSEKQICVTGTEIRHRAHNGMKIRIYVIYEQKNKGR